MAKKAVRSALTPPPTLLVMKPNGVIIQAPYASNLRGGPIEVRKGHPRLDDKYADRGWRLFDDIADNDEQRAFWPRYIEAGNKTKGRVKVDAALVERMRPKASKEARARYAEREHLRIRDLEEIVPEYNDALEARPRLEPKAKKPSEKAEPKG